MRLFVPQDLLDRWCQSGDAVVEGDVLHRGVAGARQSFSISSAAHFLRVDGGGPDDQKLVGLVKDAIQLATLRAEVVSDSAIVSDTAYVISNGFIAKAVSDVARSSSDGGSAGATCPATSDEELLTRFLLETI